MPRPSPLERDIIQALTRHISQNEEVSLTELADECHVAKSTVVKAVQKLGFRGFGDLTYSARFNAQERGGLLPRRLVEGDSEAVARELAERFERCRGRHNLIFSGDRRLSAPLASYMSRKLAMFDIFATPSYDYAMVRAARGNGAAGPQGTGPGGFALFFFHRELPAQRGLGQQPGFGEGMFAAAEAAGFQVIVFSDDERALQDRADLLVRISPNGEADVDLYAVKALMLFEMALTRVSEMRGGADA